MDKKAAKAKNKPNMTNSLHSARLPSVDDGWTLAKVDEFCLGVIHVSLSPLLERSKQSVVQNHSTIALQLKELEEVGVVELQEEVVKADGGGQEEGARDMDRCTGAVDVEVSLQTISNKTQMIPQ